MSLAPLPDEARPEVRWKNAPLGASYGSMTSMRVTDVGSRAANAGLCALVAWVLVACSSADPDDSNSSTAGSSGQSGSAGSTTGNGGTTTSDGGTSGSSGAAGSAGSSNAGSSSEGGSGGRRPGQGGNAGSASAGTPSGGQSNGGSGGASIAEPSVYPPSAGTSDLAAGIAQLNLYRAALGLSMVTLDTASSPGCEGHLQYLIEEAGTRGQGYLEHTESNHDNSHYSAENEQAGKSSDLAWGQSGGPGGAKGQSLAEAVDLWINGVYHRRPLLDPGLVKVGAASIQGYNCLNYNATGNTTVVKIDRPVLWPADGMTDVPRAFGGNEGPCPTNPSDPLNASSCGPSGFIISAVWYNFGTGRASALTSVASVTLKDSATQMEVPLLTWYADGVAGHDPARGYMRDEIAIVPQASLAASTSYQVDIDGVVNGAATKLSWSFKTGTRSE